MKKQTKLIWGLILALIAVLFVLLNTAPVMINFGFFQPRVPLIMVLIVMMLVGAIFAWILARQDWPEDKRKIEKEHAQQTQDLQKELTARDQKIQELEKQVEFLQPKAENDSDQAQNKN